MRRPIIDRPQRHEGRCAGQRMALRGHNYMQQTRGLRRARLGGARTYLLQRMARQSQLLSPKRSRAAKVRAAQRSRRLGHTQHAEAGCDYQQSHRARAVP